MERAQFAWFASKNVAHQCAALAGDCVYVQMLGSMGALGQQGMMLWLAQ